MPLKDLRQIIIKTTGNPRLNVNQDKDLNRFAAEIKDRLCNFSAHDLKKNEILRVATATDAAHILSQMDAVLRGREQDVADTNDKSTPQNEFLRLIREHQSQSQQGEPPLRQTRHTTHPGAGWVVCIKQYRSRSVDKCIRRSRAGGPRSSALTELKRIAAEGCDNVPAGGAYMEVGEVGEAKAGIQWACRGDDALVRNQGHSVDRLAGAELGLRDADVAE
jgi:hypothetical protein